MEYYKIRENIQVNTLYKYILFRDSHGKMHKYFLSTDFQITQLQVEEKKQTEVNYNNLCNRAVVNDQFVRVQHS